MPNQLIIRDMGLKDIGRVLAESGFFSDSKDASQAIVKVLAGQELGVGPITAMTGIHIIQGKPALSANLMAATVKRSGKYNYRVVELTNAICRLAFLERDGNRWVPIGESVFTIGDAQTAGTQNLRKFPRNMLFARAMSNGAKWYCPDVFGAPIYTPEELGAEEEEAEIVDVQDVLPSEAPAVAEDSATRPESDGPSVPLAEQLAEELETPPDTSGQARCSAEQIERCHLLVKQLGMPEAAYEQQVLAKRGVKSTAALTVEQAADLIIKLGKRLSAQEAAKTAENPQKIREKDIPF